MALPPSGFAIILSQRISFEQRSASNGESNHENCKEIFKDSGSNAKTGMENINSRIQAHVIRYESIWESIW
jgi:hypothetical protein